MPDLREMRLALIPVLADHSSSGYIGRTALMKYMYFLQTLRNVPLHYRFSLYSYGPFDSEVLADLSTAETLGAVESEPVYYPGGYGYKILRGQKADWAKNRAVDFLRKYKGDIQWLFKEFGGFSSAQLELISTLIYVDRELSEGRKGELSKIVAKTNEVKPHFSQDQIWDYAKQLEAKHLLRARA